MDYRITISVILVVICHHVHGYGNNGLWRSSEWLNRSSGDWVQIAADCPISCLQEKCTAIVPYESICMLLHTWLGKDANELSCLSRPRQGSSIWNCTTIDVNRGSLVF